MTTTVMKREVKPNPQTVAEETDKSSWFDMSYEEHWSEESLGMVQEVWKFDENDIQNLLTLKSLLHDTRHHPLNHPLEVARCYYDAKYNVQDAETKFRVMLLWRRQTVLDSCDGHGDNGILDYEPPLLMQQYYPSCFLDGYDNEGDPIWIDRVGAADPYAVVSKYGNDALQRYALWIREHGLRGTFARQYEQRTGRPPARLTVIIDMDGLCRRHLQVGLIAPLEEGIRTLQDYYGGMAKRILIIRAPSLFRFVWAVAQHFCNDSLKKTIVICNHRNTQRTLDQYVDRAVLPPCLCPKEGRGKAGLRMPHQLEGGVMPEQPEAERYRFPETTALKPQLSYETLSVDSSSSTTSSENRESSTFTKHQDVYRPLSQIVSIRGSSLFKGSFGIEDEAFETKITVRMKR